MLSRRVTTHVLKFFPQDMSAAENHRLWKHYSQVYQKLAEVGSWNAWHTSAWVLRSPGLDKLAPGDKFSYTAPFVLGNIQSRVEESSQGKVGSQNLHHQHLLVLSKVV